MENYRADVVIVGAGLAGIVTALELLESNLKILLIDRDSAENFGGLAKESFGGILLVDTPEQRRAKIQDSPERALADWLSFGGFGKNPEKEFWPRQWAEHYLNENNEKISRWLRGFGISFLPLPMWVERGLEVQGNSVPRWHVTWGTGFYLATRLIEVLNAHPKRANLQLLFAHKVDTLTQSGGKISGVSGQREDNQAAFCAEAAQVVIAAGGINGSLERVRQNWHRDWGQPPQTILNGAHKFADGTLHDAAARHGANITHLHNMWNYASGIHHWQPRKPGHGLCIVPPKTALWLDAHGERIMPPLVSGFDTRDLVAQICRRPPGYSWQVMNYKIAVREMAVSGAEANAAIRNRSKIGLLKTLLFGNKNLVHEMLDNAEDVVAARSLPELADKMNALSPAGGGIDAQKLAETLHRYDKEIREKHHVQDKQLQLVSRLREWRGDRIRICKSQPVWDEHALPLIAVRQFITSRKSMGGLQTDLSARVLDTAGNPLAGLYAVGEAAGFGGGGIHGIRSLEGTFLGGCIYTARRAGEAIAHGG